MKIKVKFQVGVYDQKWEDPLRLLEGLDSGDLLKWALTNMPELVLKKIHRMADGTPHLVEYIGERVL